MNNAIQNKNSNENADICIYNQQMTFFSQYSSPPMTEIS